MASANVGGAPAPRRSPVSTRGVGTLRPQFGRLHLFVGIVAFAAIKVSAADAPPPSAPPAEDALAAARRELQAMKAANAAGTEANSARTPQVTLPDFHPPTDPAPLMTKEQLDEKKAEEKRKANWLVDAMTNPKNEAAKEGRGIPGETGRDKDQNLLLGRDHHDTDVWAEAQKRALSRKDEDTKTSEPENRPPPDTVFNPLSKFMTEWMTPGSLQILGSKSDKPSGFAPGPSDGGGAAAVIPETGGLDALAGMMGNSVTPTKSANNSGSGNPFLAGLTATPEWLPSVLSTPTLSLPPAQSMAPQFTPSPPPASAPEKPVVPDFVKPAVDDKYFKPLKRF
jgi:hypothetical protein